MKAFIFGHSHMWGLRWALSQSKAHPDLQLILCGTAEFPGSLVYENFRTGNLSVNSSLLTALHRAKADPASGVLVSGVQGNQYNALGLLTDGCPFDFHIPGWPTSPASDVTLVPYDAVRAMMAEELREFEIFCQRLKALSYRGLVHLASPPPIADSDFVQSKLPPLPSGEMPEVSTPNLRLKLWTIQTTMMDEILAKVGGTLLRPPYQSYDSDGFLKKEYWKDSVHANAGYYAMQLNDIQTILDELEPVGVS